MHRRNRSSQFGEVALAGLCVWLAGHAAAVEINSEVGTFGEIRNWLIIKTPEGRLEVDPFAALGGEMNYAAMGNPGLVPSAGGSPGSARHQHRRKGPDRRRDLGSRGDGPAGHARHLE